MAVLNQAQLRGLKERKYKAQGISITEVFIQPFWEWLVTLVPLWFAPNLLTFTGLLVNLITCVAVVLTDLNGIGQSPRWLYLITGFGVFVYQALDGIDGKQARRTGSANPLGEIFDHGCDAISTFVVALAGLSAVGINEYPYVALTFVLLIEFVNYVYHWQTYVSGCLYFKKVDCTEGQFCYMFIMTVVYFFGTEMWTVSFPGLGLPLKILMGGGVIGISFFNLISAFIVVFSQGIGKNGATVADTSVLSPIIPSMVLIGCTIYYAVFSPSLMLQNHAMLFFTAIVGPFVKLVMIMILAGICSSPLPLVDTLLAGPIIAVLNLITGCLLPEFYVLLVIAIFNIYELIHFSVSVVREVCNYLDVSCFKIPYNPPASKTSTKSTK